MRSAGPGRPSSPSTHSSTGCWPPRTPAGTLRRSGRLRRAMRPTPLPAPRPFAFYSTSWPGSAWPVTTPWTLPGRCAGALRVVTLVQSLCRALGSWPREVDTVGPVLLGRRRAPGVARTARCCPRAGPVRCRRQRSITCLEDRVPTKTAVHGSSKQCVECLPHVAGGSAIVEGGGRSAGARPAAASTPDGSPPHRSTGLEASSVLIDVRPAVLDTDVASLTHRRRLPSGSRRACSGGDRSARS